MGLQEIQNERFENSEVMGKYWPKQDSEVLKGEMTLPVHPHMCGSHGTSMALEDSTNAIRNGYGPKCGYLVMLDSQLSTYLCVAHQVLPEQYLVRTLALLS